MNANSNGILLKYVLFLLLVHYKHVLGIKLKEKQYLIYNKSLKIIFLILAYIYTMLKNTTFSSSCPIFLNFKHISRAPKNFFNQTNTTGQSKMIIFFPNFRTSAKNIIFKLYKCKCKKKQVFGNMRFSGQFLQPNFWNLIKHYN